MVFIFIALSEGNLKLNGNLISFFLPFSTPPAFSVFFNKEQHVKSTDYSCKINQKKAFLFVREH